jgi:hypothetical protein
MDVVERVVEAIILIENGLANGSVNKNLVLNYSKWNIGHLIFVGQMNAVPIYFGEGIVTPEHAKELIHEEKHVWAAWPSLEESIAGVRRDVRAKFKMGMSIRQAIEAYAPPSDRNDTESYIRSVCRLTGLTDTSHVKV